LPLLLAASLVSAFCAALAKSLRSFPTRFSTLRFVIGLGILRGPGEIAAVIPDPFFYLALWLLGGLFVLLSIEHCCNR